MMQSDRGKRFFRLTYSLEFLIRLESVTCSPAVLGDRYVQHLDAVSCLIEEHREQDDRERNNEQGFNLGK